MSDESRAITLNGRPAPIRRDLSGADFIYELTLAINKLNIGDIIRIPYFTVAVHMRGPALEFGPFPGMSLLLMHDVSRNEYAFMRTA